MHRFRRKKNLEKRLKIDITTSIFITPCFPAYLRPGGISARPHVQSQWRVRARIASAKSLRPDSAAAAGTPGMRRRANRPHTTAHCSGNVASKVLRTFAHAHRIRTIMSTSRDQAVLSLQHMRNCDLKLKNLWNTASFSEPCCLNFLVKTCAISNFSFRAADYFPQIGYLWKHFSLLTQFFCDFGMYRLCEVLVLRWCEEFESVLGIKILEGRRLGDGRGLGGLL